MPSADIAPTDTLETAIKTPLFDWHQAQGGKMVPFAGYAMPVRYRAGIMAEHEQARAKAALFDVSHMGQARLVGGDPAAALERLIPGDIQALDVSRMRYTQFTNETGGILDDLMVTRRADDLFLVVNAAVKERDFAVLEAGLAGSGTELEVLEGRAMIALQGPQAASVLARLAPDSAKLVFLQGAALDLDGIPAFVTRSGYTGEDGFELYIAESDAVALAERLAQEPEVAPAGLGARDSLRLEAGLCLYGHDIDESTTPIEAGLAWSISKRRRAEGGFPGDAVVQQQLAEKPGRRRVGLRLDGRAPAREGAEIVADGQTIGTVTSGGFAPTLGQPIAMGYVPRALAAADTVLSLMVRGKPLTATVAKMPFVETHYVTG